MAIKLLLAEGNLESHVLRQRDHESIARIQNRPSSKSAISKAATHSAVEPGGPRVDTNGDGIETTITVRRPAQTIQVAAKKVDV